MATANHIATNHSPPTTGYPSSIDAPRLLYYIHQNTGLRVAVRTMPSRDTVRIARRKSNRLHLLCSDLPDEEKRDMPGAFGNESARAKTELSAIMSDEKPFYAPDRGTQPPRQPTPGEEVWRLRKDDRVQSCELRNADRAGAGWDVIVRENDELLFSRRCDERGARVVAESFKQDLLRTGRVE